MKASKSAQLEMNSITSERSAQGALTRNIHPAADLVYKLGEEVTIYSKQKKGMAWFT